MWNQVSGLRILSSLPRKKLAMNKQEHRIFLVREKHIPVELLQLFSTAHAFSSPQHYLKALIRIAVAVRMQQSDCIQPTRDTQLSQLLLQCYEWNWRNAGFAFDTCNCSSLLWGRTQVAADEQKGSHVLPKAQNYHLSSIQWSDTMLVPHDNTLCCVKRQTDRDRAKGCLQGWWLSLFEAMKKKRGITSLCNYFKGKEIEISISRACCFFSLIWWLSFMSWF